MLIAGASGLVGPYLTAAFERRNWSVTTLARRTGDVRIDLGRGRGDASWPEVDFDVVVNCIALTDVDACERSPHEAWCSNAAVVAELVTAIAATSHLVQISTDQVYGNHRGPHRECTASPVNVYGRTKLAGEMAALGHPLTTVIRTNIFGPSLVSHRSSLSDWIVGRLAGGHQVEGFMDLTFSPVHLSTLADITAHIVSERVLGTFNVGSREPLSKFEFARVVGRHCGFSEQLVVPVRSTGVPGRAPRPADTSLETSKFQDATGVRLPTIMEEIERL